MSKSLSGLSYGKNTLKKKFCGTIKAVFIIKIEDCCKKFSEVYHILLLPKQ